VLIDQAQQMIFGNLIFHAKVVKKRLRAGVISHHEQPPDVMVNNIEELWHAYNLNIGPSQASTEGLFQQTRPVNTNSPGAESLA
jgi:hypothetical protein